MTNPGWLEAAIGAHAGPLTQPAVHVVSGDEWSSAAETLAAQGALLITLWGTHREAQALVSAAYWVKAGVLVLELPLERASLAYPSLSHRFPCAVRLERAVRDLSGLDSTQADRRPWLRHASWPSGFHPLAPLPARVQADRGAAAAREEGGEPDADYAFVRVEGEGVHEIAVGPVHAGIIEPGHFRFSVVGEKVLRLEERLGYVHKGIERRFTDLPLLEGHRLAARVSGDSAVAFAWAYCQALERMTHTPVPARALALRGLALELERLANHLGDLGALGNDAGFAFGLAQFGRLKELLLRATEVALGRRYLFDFIVPGGARRELDATAGTGLEPALLMIAAELRTLRDIYEEHPGLRDRFLGAGRVSPALARRLGLTGLAGRASGQARDVRCDLPEPPYDALAPAKIVSLEGDVAARVTVRFDEAAESIRLARALMSASVGGEPLRGASLPAMPPAGALGIGLIEGWRGPVLVALEAEAGGRVRRCHVHDPSWQNWPVLEHAIIDNIVPDFPLINKSFNLSYSGHDL